MKHIITFSLIAAICWMTWVPAFAQSSEASSDYYSQQFIGGTASSIVGGASTALIAAMFTYFQAPNRSKLTGSTWYRAPYVLENSMLGSIIGLPIGAVLGVAFSTPEDIEGNWIGALIGSLLGETISIAITIAAVDLALRGKLNVDSYQFTIQFLAMTVGLSVLGATIGFNFGATTPE